MIDIEILANQIMKDVISVGAEPLKELAHCLLTLARLP
jgi:hypothetical protein